MRVLINSSKSFKYKRIVVDFSAVVFVLNFREFPPASFSLKVMHSEREQPSGKSFHKLCLLANDSKIKIAR